MSAGSRKAETLRTLPDDDVRAILWRFAQRYDLQMLVQPLKELLTGQASKAASIDNLWERVKLYCTVYDPLSGGYRVNYSLFFEIFAGLTTLAMIFWVVIREFRRARRV